MTRKLSVSVPDDLWERAKREFPVGDSKLVQLGLEALLNDPLRNAIRNYIES